MNRRNASQRQLNRTSLRYHSSTCLLTKSVSSCSVDASGMLLSYAVAPFIHSTAFLLNWHATPYHLPIFLAQAKGYYAAEGVKVALLEPNDPSDVTEIIGSGKVDMGCKAMIHVSASCSRADLSELIGRRCRLLLGRLAGFRLLLLARYWMSRSQG